MWDKATVFLLKLSWTFCLVSAIARRDLFPYGPHSGDSALPEGDDETSEVLTLKRPLYFYETKFSELYVNTFQVVLAYDDTDTFALFLYPHKELQFYGTRPKESYNVQLELPARVGFSRGELSFMFLRKEGPFYSVTSSEQTVKNLHQVGNTGVPGLWLYRIGSSFPLDNVVAAEAGGAQPGGDSVVTLDSTLNNPGWPSQPEPDYPEQDYSEEIYEDEDGQEEEEEYPTPSYPEPPESSNHYPASEDPSEQLPGPVPVATQPPSETDTTQLPEHHLKHEPSYPQASYPDPSYPQASYPDPSYPEPSYPQASYPDPSYPQASYPDPSYPQASYPEPSYPEPSYPDPSYPQASYPEPSYPDPSYPQASYPEPSYPEPSYPDPSYPQASYPDPSYPEPSYPQASYPDPSYPQASYPEPSYPEPSYPDPSYPDPSYPQASYPEPSYPEPSYPEPSYPDPSYPQASYPEPSYPNPSYPQASYPEPSYPEPSYPKPAYPQASYPEPSNPQPREADVQAVYPEGGVIPLPESSPPHTQGRSVVSVDEDVDVDAGVFVYNTESRETCAQFEGQCSRHAYCSDYLSGFCCHCQSGYYGNGRHCLPDGVPHRVNGKVSGRVLVGATPVDLGSVDLHAYVVVSDGRAYTAVSHVPEPAGWALMPLSPIGGLFGWLFALELTGHENGFSVMGAEFARYADITFYPGNERLSIIQKAQGLDSQNYLTVSTEIQGQVPFVSPGATVQMEPYKELYQYLPSVVKSSSLREYTVLSVGSGSQTFSYQLSQNVTYQDCRHRHRSLPDTQQLSVERVFMLYNKEEQVLRYALTNQIGPVREDPEPVVVSPCYEGTHECDMTAQCIPGEGTQYQCRCATGYRGDGRNCYDMDECAEGLSSCGSHSLCVNLQGSHRCECQSGYHFTVDGRTCIDIDECASPRCDPHATCFNTPGSFHCRCVPGYKGDGLQCLASPAPTQRPESVCERWRASLLDHYGGRPAPHHFIPQCDDLGLFNPLQCYGDNSYCWCVDQDGRELEGTRSQHGVTPACIPTVAPPTLRPTPRPDVTPPPAGVVLLYAQGQQIGSLPLNGTRLSMDKAAILLALHGSIVVGIDYDCRERTVYWTDVAARTISRASLEPGAEPESVVNSGLLSPEGLAVDYLRRSMFWVDSGLDKIEAARLDGTERHVLFDTDLVNPRAIAVDPRGGNLYWTDWNREGPKIETSTVDGANRRVLVKDDIGLPNALTFDPLRKQLCWADAGTKRLECAQPDGTGRHVIHSNLNYPFSLVSYSNHFYYTDWRRDGVMALSRDTSQFTDEYLPDQRSHLYGITVAYPRCASGKSTEMLSTLHPCFLVLASLAPHLCKQRFQIAGSSLHSPSVSRC
ncbi:Nidogen-1 [Acipenser ruthenus]|uniref:Nidogen-1 n=1 Tax=Acipenser ruthenus TaxID=7906 RepID=A0A444V611_ACIRT|nr:Nidogen-1 [Acipenser ruthenus]